MTPDEYRQRWGLSRDYPMVAPAYAEMRSAMAKKIGLGTEAGGGTAAGQACRRRPRRRARAAQGDARRPPDEASGWSRPDGAWSSGRDAVWRREIMTVKSPRS